MDARQVAKITHTHSLEGGDLKTVFWEAALGPSQGRPILHFGKDRGGGDGGNLNKLLASQFPVGLCPLDLPGIPLHLEVLVAFAPAEFEHLQQCTALRHEVSITSQQHESK